MTTVARAMSRPRSAWSGFVGSRLLGSLLGLVVLVVGTFFLVALLPGDPAVLRAGAEADVADIERIRIELGLDGDVLVRLVDYVGALVQGDLGTSFVTARPVAEAIGSRIGVTLALAFCSVVVVAVTASVLGGAVGFATAAGRRPRLDAAFTTVTSLLATVPAYVLATVLVVTISLGLHALPPAYSARQGVAGMVLPVVALAVPPTAALARVVRRETIAVLGSGYLRTARAWRLSPARIVLRYVLPNVAASTLSLCGTLLAGLIGGSVIVENVFAVPGLGVGLISAIGQRDYPVVQGIVLVLGILSAAVIVLVDVLLALIDPRRIRRDVLL